MRTSLQHNNRQACARFRKRKIISQQDRQPLQRARSAVAVSPVAPGHPDGAVTAASAWARPWRVGTRDCRYVTATRLRRRLRALVVKIAQTPSINGRKPDSGYGPTESCHERRATLPRERGRMLVGSRTVRTALSSSRTRHRGSVAVTGAPRGGHGGTSRDLEQSRSPNADRIKPAVFYPLDLHRSSPPLPLAGRYVAISSGLR
jgi:hypothetical protein